MNKRGIVMIYVIIFMLISQLIYWGLLRFNQVNTASYIDFQDYYTARIQELLSHNIVSSFVEDDYIDLENHMNQNLDHQYETHSIANLDEWLDLSNQFGVAYSTSGHYERIHIFSQEIFLPESFKNSGYEFKSVSWSGVINGQNELERYDAVGDFDLVHEYELIKQKLTDQSFRLVSQNGYRIPIRWTPKDLPAISFQTNHGSTILSRTKGVKKTETQIVEREFNRTTNVAALNTNYAIYWRDYIFERELSE